MLRALAVVMGQQEPARQKFMEAGMMPHIISALGAECAVVQHPTHRGLVVSMPKVFAGRTGLSAWVHVYSSPSSALDGGQQASRRNAAL